MADTLADLSRAIIAARAVDETDVMTLRKLVWADQALNRDVLDHLFQINDTLSAPSLAFADMFCEAVVHYALRQSPPHNFITEKTAHWLEARFCADGRLESHAELETLVHILEQAENAPETLKLRAIAQIESAILTGIGPTRKAGDIRPGTVDAAEVTLLRRLIFARGGDSGLVVSAHEAERLFSIKDATLGADNAPEWTLLFVQAVGNHLMAHNAFRGISREEATRLNAVMDDAQVSIGGFLRRVSDSFSLKTLLSPKAAFGGQERRWADENAIAADRAIIRSEVDWLKSQIVADAKTDALEKALLAFIAEETASLNPGLEELRRVA